MAANFETKMEVKKSRLKLKTKKNKQVPSSPSSDVPSGPSEPGDVKRIESGAVIEILDDSDNTGSGTSVCGTDAESDRDKKTVQPSDKCSDPALDTLRELLLSISRKRKLVPWDQLPDLPPYKPPECMAKNQNDCSSTRHEDSPPPLPKPCCCMIIPGKTSRPSAPPNTPLAKTALASETQLPSDCATSKEKEAGSLVSKSSVVSKGKNSEDILSDSSVSITARQIVEMDKCGSQMLAKTSKPGQCTNAGDNTLAQSSHSSTLAQNTSQVRGNDSALRASELTGHYKIDSDDDDFDRIDFDDDFEMNPGLNVSSAWKPNQSASKVDHSLHAKDTLTSAKDTLRAVSAKADIALKVPSADFNTANISHKKSLAESVTNSDLSALQSVSTARSGGTKTSLFRSFSSTQAEKRSASSVNGPSQSSSKVSSTSDSTKTKVSKPSGETKFLFKNKQSTAKQPTIEMYSRASTSSECLQNAGPSGGGFSGTSASSGQKTDTVEKKQKSETDSSQLVSSCPLCQMQFSKGMSQMEIDGHIAACLSASSDDIVW